MPFSLSHKFPVAMITACVAVLDSGIQCTDAHFCDDVLFRMNAPEGEAVLIEVAILDALDEGHSQKLKTLESRLRAEVIASPRGYYAVVGIERDGATSYKVIASDGSGTQCIQGMVFDNQPCGYDIMDIMLAFEIKQCREAIERKRFRKVAIKDCKSGRYEKVLNWTKESWRLVNPDSVLA